MAMTREQAIDILLTNDIFYKSSIEERSSATEFYIKWLMAGDDINDIDRYAWINTLFGYDVGKENADEIDHYFYEKDEEVLELDFRDKEKFKNAVKELNLDLDFSKFATTDTNHYNYF